MSGTVSAAIERPATLPLSAFVICQDEEAIIAGCLDSLAICEEIVVVDSGSSDGTLGIVEARRAAGLPIVLLHQPWLGYAAQKQFALERTTRPWCLSLDADERLDDDLRRSLPDLMRAPAGVSGWRLRRAPATMAGLPPPPAGVYAKPILRLVRRGEARFDATALVHEGLVVTGRVRTASRGRIRHDRHLPYPDQIRKEVVYARLKAMERVRKGRRPSVVKLVLNPLWAFFRSFVLHRWFLAGRTGFVQAATSAIYTFSAETLHFEEAWRAAAGPEDDETNPR